MLTCAWCEKLGLVSATSKLYGSWECNIRESHCFTERPGAAFPRPAQLFTVKIQSSTDRGCRDIDFCLRRITTLRFAHTQPKSCRAAIVPPCRSSITGQSIQGLRRRPCCTFSRCGPSKPFGLPVSLRVSQLFTMPFSVDTAPFRHFSECVVHLLSKHPSRSFLLPSGDTRLIS